MAGAYTPTRGKFAGQSFTSERQYRNALAREKGYPSWYAQQRTPKPVRTQAAETQLRPAEQQARRNALDALSKMRRDKLPLARAARESGTTTNAVLRYAGTALAKDASGRYVAKYSDRLYRPMVFLTDDGQITLAIRDSRTASKVGKYWVAVNRYLETGNGGALQAFRGKHLTVDGVRYVFVTDLDLIDRLAGAGEVRFEDIYPRTI